MSIWTSRRGDKPGNPEFCRESVHSREPGGYSWLHSHQCSRKPICKRVVDGEEYGFCKQHDPEAVKARGKARQEQWAAERQARDREYDRQKRTTAAMDACKAAIEQIAKGHNDPRTLAVETLALFP